MPWNEDFLCRVFMIKKDNPIAVDKKVIVFLFLNAGFLKNLPYI